MKKASMPYECLWLLIWVPSIFIYAGVSLLLEISFDKMGISETTQTTAAQWMLVFLEAMAWIYIT